MHELIVNHPLATLVTLSANGIDANHIPLHLTPGEGRFGVLRGHIARANPLWQEPKPDFEALAIFQGPDSYISPSWYPTKQEHGKVIPTWNYAVAHAYGRLEFISDPEWLKQHLVALTNHHEAAFPQPWAVEDAPKEFIDKLIGAIIGVEMTITRIEGKRKASQNQPSVNQEGVVNGLKELGNQSALEMAALISKRSDN